MRDGANIERLPTSSASRWCSPANVTSCIETDPRTAMTARMMPGGPVADAVFVDLQPRDRRAHRDRSHARSRHDPRWRRGVERPLRRHEAAEGGRARLRVSPRPPPGGRDRRPMWWPRSVSSTATRPSTRCCSSTPPHPRSTTRPRSPRWTLTRTSTACTRSTWALGAGRSPDRCRALLPVSRRSSRTDESRWQAATLCILGRGDHPRAPARAAAVTEAPDRERGGDRRAHRRARLGSVTRDGPRS